MKHAISVSIEPCEGCLPNDMRYRVRFTTNTPDGRELVFQQIHPATMLYEFIQGQLNNNLRVLMNELEVTLKKQQKQRTP